MKLVKKLLCLFMCIIILSVLIIPAFATDEADKYDNLFTNSYDRLANMGLPEDYLDCISQSMMDKIILYMGDCEVSDVSFNDDFQMQGSSDIKAKSLDILLKDKDTGAIVEEIVSVYWVWNGNPIARQNDRLVISTSNPDFIYCGNFYSEDYQIRNGKINNISNINHTLAGIKEFSQVPATELTTYTDLKLFGGDNGGCVTFVLIPNQPSENIENLTNTITVQYDHYYKTTLFVIIISIAIITAVIVILTNARKKKTKIKDCD